ncbi:carotenoid-cleaving dioxygenase, mitochondrial-like isoform X2 [Tachysurus vachellii]|uniref:carotenoid-cleaving dioxygenase, mitochondrial-like isoform X2 n=1 Tax=Tachysurus vachellii TaxID=175792 RepID=UPI00296B1874|nr:carotenoid-cleaving dioxygenase, mitochondrial-like isoform X2 [Tachysurus vachellii]
MIAQRTRFHVFCSAISSTSHFTIFHGKHHPAVVINKQKHTYRKWHGLPEIAPLLQSVEETPEPIPTTVKGIIPTWIRGNLLRNGPGKFEFGNQHFNHWFDGMALMHSFQVADGQVTYRSRFLRSDSYKKNSEMNRIVVSEFGTLALPDPCKNIFQRFMSFFEMTKPTDNANVNFVKYKGDYYVSTETNFIHKIDPDTLETKEKVDWSKFIAVNGATAHPHVDPDGTVYNMGNSYGRKGVFYNIIKVPPGNEAGDDTLQGAKVLCSISPAEKNKPSYYHSFAMSENYVVFIEQPIKIDIMKIVTARMKGKGISDCIYWDPKQETIFHVVNKHTGKLSPLKYHTKALSNFHQINAFEENGFLILDMCCSDDGQALQVYSLQNLRKSGEALDEVYNSIDRYFPRRFVLPLCITSDIPLNQNLNTRHNSSASAVCLSKDKVFCMSEDLHDHELLDYGGFEFPHIHYDRCNTKPYRFIYGCGFGHLVADSLIKIDLESKKIKAWRQPGVYPSEPVFVPSPNSEEEDDGVILSVVLTPNEDKGTFLLVLDAKTFEEVGRAKVPVNIPSGFHGTFKSLV